MADSREARFQQDVIEAMAAHGCEAGTASGYDCSSALYTEDLLGNEREAWPERWEKFCNANPQVPKIHSFCSSIAAVVLLMWATALPSTNARIQR